jgi:protein gp37
VEKQFNADVRIPVLLSIPAVIRFVSAEPMLGPLDMECYFDFIYEDDEGWTKHYEGLDWVICGGESGSHQKDPKTARLLNMEWVRSLRDQCVDACIPFFFKQDSDEMPGQRPYVVEEDGSITTWKQTPHSSEFDDYTQLKMF